MEDIKKVKSISLWIFIVPFIGVNACLILITHFHSLFPNQEDVIGFTIPYIDGGASISRTARVFPTYLIFKPAMFLTSYLLIRYWLWNKNIINYFDPSSKHLKKILFFGISSAVLLTIHSIFLGIKFDIQIYKLMRRVVLLLFIIFELIAQGILVYHFFKIREKITNLINSKVLFLKALLVSILTIVAILSLPILLDKGNTHFKHALEWNYFVGVILFYLFSRFFWRRTT